LSKSDSRQERYDIYRSEDLSPFVLFELRNRLLEIETSLVACACHTVAAELSECAIKKVALRTFLAHVEKCTNFT
jgi:hypothetical protein